MQKLFKIEERHGKAFEGLERKYLELEATFRETDLRAQVLHKDKKLLQEEVEILRERESKHQDIWQR